VSGAVDRVGIRVSDMHASLPPVRGCACRRRAARSPMPQVTLALPFAAGMVPGIDPSHRGEPPANRRSDSCGASRDPSRGVHDHASLESSDLHARGPSVNWTRGKESRHPRREASTFVEEGNRARLRALPSRVKRVLPIHNLQRVLPPLVGHAGGHGWQAARRP
jgi:hypothetical protein